MLDTAAPLSVALRGGGPALTWLLPIVDLAAVIGLGSVVLIVMLAQPRVLMAMGRDGLVPPVFASRASAFPHASLGHVDLRFVGGCVGRPISALHSGAAGIRRHLDRFHRGSGFCPRLRNTDPGRHRPFRTPFVPFVPIGGLLICGYLLTGIPLRTWAVYGIWERWDFQFTSAMAGVPPVACAN